MRADPAPRADPLIRCAVAGDGGPCESVYLGFGLATRHGLGEGRLPLDALAMVLVAARRREQLGAARVVHLIADRHALYNGFATRRDVDRRARMLAAELRELAAALGLGPYEVVLASEIEDRLHPRLMGEAWARCPDLYAARQAADVEWARRRWGAGVKVGWSMSGDVAATGGRDEPYFDRVHRSIFGGELAAVYTAPGRALDPARPRCSPYTLLPGQPRLTFSSGADAIRVHCASASMRRHLAPICDRGLEQLGVAVDGALADRLEVLLAHLPGRASGAARAVAA